jgi:hypothetical protein
MAELKAVVTVTRIAAEMIESVEVLVNGTSSSNPPVERVGSSPVFGGGVWTHTYDWSEGGWACNTTYSLQAIARVVLHTTAASGTIPVTCPAC